MRAFTSPLARFTTDETCNAEARMSGFAEYERYDALGLAELVQKLEVTADEVLDAALARVAGRNPAINAVVMPLEDYARKAIAAGLPAGPFTGVPYLMKDLTAS